MKDVCVDTKNDPMNCGGCGQADAKFKCAAANAKNFCAASTCDFKCKAGFGDCDQSGANGCEASLATSENCGACGVVCGSGTACIDKACKSCGNGTFAELSKAGGMESMGSYFEDVDDDGKLDVIWTNQLDQTATIFWGDGSANFGAQSTTFFVGRTEAYVAFGDLDGDGRKDAVSSNQDFGRLTVSMQTSARTFGPSSNINQTGFPQWVSLVDANRDGKLDLLVRASNCMNLRLGDGTGGFGAPTCMTGVPTSVGRVRTGDLDGDGVAEVVWVNDTNTGYVVGMLDDKGVVKSTTNVVLAGFTNAGAFDLYDLNRDGRLDILAFAKSGMTTQLVSLYNQGGLAFSTCSFGPTAGNQSGSSVGDLNGDKKPEYTRQTTCSFCGSTYYLNVGQ